MSPQQPDNETLLSRAIAGDQAALTVLLTRCHDTLRARIDRRMPRDVRSSLEADDVVQQTFVAAFREIRRFEVRGPDSFDRWLATIAIRSLRNEIKARRTLKRGGGRRQVGDGGSAEDSMIALLDLVSAPGRTPSRSMVRREAVSAVQHALEELPADYREAVFGVYIEGASVAEVARRMGRTERAIHNLCFKAKQRLGDLLGDDPR